MDLEAKLPHDVHSMEYVKNSHYLKLTDDDGNSTKLDARHIIQFTCKECKNVFWMGTNQVSCCPSCKGTKIDKDWVDLQLSFIPERETRFKSPVQNEVVPAGGIEPTVARVKVENPDR